ncbi:hypothetical protein [Imhoffiella purpurea]|uniref:Uncharacterized protein n=1 Tax=Imhoffiella purpurea TaxID=1249627 RepID=W9VAH5_9GAMM|nr:hypothetical protein [Imhoffiella purpurea]EXJ13896.1 hypothetical protein D779_3203 [Imhoffiella purpurea]
MSTYVIRETFFRPDAECAREETSIPASLYNAMLSLRREEGSAGPFVPIRSMQYMAFIDREETIFVDAAGGYAHRDGQGGRLIRIAWRPASKRDSLSAPVFCEVVYYFTGSKEIQRRLLSEFGPAVAGMLERRRADVEGVCEGRILPFAVAR